MSFFSLFFSLVIVLITSDCAVFTLSAYNQHKVFMIVLLELM